MMTDKEIKSNLEWLKTVGDRIHSVTIGKEFIPTVIDYINRLEAENEELAYKLGCLLCHATGGKLSKHTYPLRVMESYVNDTIQEYCEEAEAESKVEAYKEFADKVHTEIHQALESNYKARAERENKEINLYLDDLFWNYCSGKIDCLRGLDDFVDETYKEMVGE